jgi:hypothetical protein
MCRFYPFGDRVPNVRSPKNWKPKILPPHPSGTRDLPRRALGPGPNRRPRPPDSQFLEPFRPRHPDPHAGENGATPGRSRARRRGRNLRFSVFQNFGGAKAKSSELTSSHVRTTHEPIPGVVISFSTSRYRPASVRVRVSFGWPNPLPTLGFKYAAAQIGGHLRIIKGCMFRDRLGWRLDRGDAKQYRYRSSTYKANYHRHVYLLINGSLVRARAGERYSEKPV